MSDYNFPLEPDYIDETSTDYRNPHPKLERFNVEDCYRLTTGHFGRHLMHRAETPETEPERSFFVHRGLSKAEVFYRFFKKDALTFGLSIRCHAGERWLAQNIELDYSFVNYGMRPFMLCRCGYRASTLYLRPDKYFGFLCRSCANIVYEVRTLNKNSKNIRFSYLANRMRKLMTMEDLLRRPVYNNVGTRRFRSFVAAHQKWDPIFAVVQ